METSQIKSFFQRNSIQATFKLLLIGILVLILLIPRAMILDLVRERKNLNESVKNEVALGWGGKQIVSGPFLVIPYRAKYLSEDKKTMKETKKNLILFPDKINTIGDVTTVSKHRSIYPVLLYKSDLNMSGQFTIPDENKTKIAKSDLLFGEASIILGLADIKGIQDNIDFDWNNVKLDFSPGSGAVKINAQFPANYGSYMYNGNYMQQPLEQPIDLKGLQAFPKMDGISSNYSFNIKLNFRGFEGLMFAPIAKTTFVNIKSKFTDPNFTGNFLPDQKTGKDGFDAKWKVLEYNKSLPDFQKGDDQITIGDNLFGVKIQYPVDNYDKTSRAGKYMILFIALTFLIVFLTEIVQKLRIHIFQYLLIGLALAIFFTLLLSISEFLGFDISYLISSISIIAMLFLYSLEMFHNRKSSYLLLGLLVSMFLYIYVIIQLEKTALLFGSIGLFIVLALTMYVSRKIKWYENDNHLIPE